MTMRLRDLMRLLNAYNGDLLVGVRDHSGENIFNLENVSLDLLGIPDPVLGERQEHCVMLVMGEGRKKEKLS